MEFVPCSFYNYKFIFRFKTYCTNNIFTIFVMKKGIRQEKTSRQFFKNSPKYIILIKIYRKRTLK